MNWLARPFSRCLMCNVILLDADTATLARMPADARVRSGPFLTCPRCRRSYWPGSHVKRMRARLARFAGQDGGETP